MVSFNDFEGRAAAIEYALFEARAGCNQARMASHNLRATLGRVQTFWFCYCLGTFFGSIETKVTARFRCVSIWRIRAIRRR